jgi:hypothetical protein
MADLRRICEEKVRVVRSGIVLALLLWGGYAVVVPLRRRSTVWGVAQGRELLGGHDAECVAATGRVDGVCLLEVLQAREVTTAPDSASAGQHASSSGCPVFLC